MVCLDFRRVAPVTVISGPSSVPPRAAGMKGRKRRESNIFRQRRLPWNAVRVAGFSLESQTFQEEAKHQAEHEVLSSHDVASIEC